VLSGTLHVYISDGKQQPLATIAAGECVGEMSVLDSQKPSARVIAAEPARVLELHQGLVWEFIDATEGMARNLLYILSNRLRINTSALLESLQQQVHFERSAHLDPLTELQSAEPGVAQDRPSAAPRHTHDTARQLLCPVFGVGGV
jgi:CRP-like cAMP-binding protein